MYKKWVYCLRYVCALSCIFVMLFSSTLSVNAASSTWSLGTTFSGSDVEYMTANTDYAVSQQSSGNFSKGTQTRYENVNYCLFVRSDNLVDKPSDLNTQKPIYFSGNFHFKVYKEGYVLNDTTKPSTFNYLNIYDMNHNPIELNITSTNHRDYVEGNFNFKSAYVNFFDVSTYESSGYRISIPFYIYFDFYGAYANDVLQGGDYKNKIHLEIDTLNSTALNIVYNNDESANFYVSDSGTQQELNDLNQTQESIKDTTEDTNETTHNIFDSISSFFGSFFSNLIGVFVPESGYFETWFNRVNTMLADKLGILYYPFNLFISFIQELVSYFSEQQNTCVITFPEIAFTNRATNERYVFLQAQQVDLGSYSFSIGASDNSSVVGTNGWTTPVQIIRRLNSIVLFFLFLGLLRQKLNLIIRGEDKDS